MRFLLDHFNKAFTSAMSNSDKQSIDEHMVKFKGRSAMKQYMKQKPIQWGFKFWFRSDSKTGYLYQLDLYLGKKSSVDYQIGENVVIELSSTLENTNCFLYFDNFFNSPTLMEHLLDKGVYGIGTVRKNRKNMPEMPADKGMVRGDYEFQYSKNLVCVKWFDNRGVLLLGSNVEGMDEVTTVYRRLKGSATKPLIDCPNIVKLYNHGMGGVDLIDQRTSTYHLDRKSKIRFYLRIFFDLLDVSVVNSYLIFNSMFGVTMSLLDYKISVAKSLIGSFCSRARSFPSQRTTKRKISQVMPSDFPQHLPEFQVSRRRCAYCKAEGKDTKTFVACTI